VAAGLGSYKGESSAALGLFYRPNENLMLSFGSAFGNGERMWNAGMSLKIGSGASQPRLSRAQLEETVREQNGRLEAQEERLSRMQAQIDRLLAGRGE